MATYIMLMNWTGQGIRNVSGWFGRVTDARRRIESADGRLEVTYVTTGAYDAVAVLSGVEDTAMAKLAMGMGQRDNVRTTTLRAFNEQEAVQLVQGL
jgi:uncharacterized protein with GYD domain